MRTLITAGLCGVWLMSIQGGPARGGMVSFARMDVSIAPPGCAPSCPDGPAAVVTGDFDGDGDNDVATANTFSDDVTVLLGDGAGTLTVLDSFAADNSPIAIATGHVSSDDILDLAIANQSSGTVSVLLGNGDGTFQAPINVPVGFAPTGIVLGHFDADDDLDIATANFGTATGMVCRGSDGLPDGDVCQVDLDCPGTETCVSVNDQVVAVLLGNGDGTFAAASSISLSGRPSAIATGLIDGGQNLDLAVTRFATNQVAVMLGNGAGGFSLAGSVSVGSPPVAVVLEDFDGNGTIDLATANENDSTASVRLGNGNGTFGAAQHYSVGEEPVALAARDLDGDRIPDLATADAFGSDQVPDSSVSLLMGNGNGTFAAAEFFGVATTAVGLAVADLGGHAGPDIVTANVDSDDLSVLINTTPAAAVDLGRAVGQPGGKTCLPATLSANSQNVVTTENEITFDSSLFTAGACLINPAIGPATTPAKQCGVTSQGAGMELVTVSGANTQSIPGGLLYSLELNIDASAAPGTYALANTAGAFNSTAGGVPAFGAPGEVVVSACTGDCNASGRVTLGELQLAAFLNVTRLNPCDAAMPENGCPVADKDGSGRVSLGELQEAAFRNVTRVCP